MVEENLNVLQLLYKTYDNLEERNPHEKMNLNPNFAVARIDKYDRKYPMKGCIGYQSTNLYDFEGKKWAVSIGLGNCTFSDYVCDITAHRITPETFEWYEKSGDVNEGLKRCLTRRIRAIRDFKQSLVYGLSDGRLIVGSTDPLVNVNPYEKMMRDLLEEEYNKNAILHLTKTLYLNKTLDFISYKPDFVDILTETIETVLKTYEEGEKIGENYIRAS